MTPRIRVAVSATFLLGACAFVQAATPDPIQTGFPATIVGYAYNQRGDAITIP